MGAEAGSGHAWVRVCGLGELPVDGSGLSLPAGRGQVAVFHIGGELFALDDSCPHHGGSLGLGVVKDGDVTCPWHGFHFCLSSGENTDGLDERVRVRPVRVTASDDVEVRLGGIRAEQD